MCVCACASLCSLHAPSSSVPQCVGGGASRDAQTQIDTGIDARRRDDGFIARGGTALRDFGGPPASPHRSRPYRALLRDPFSCSRAGCAQHDSASAWELRWWWLLQCAACCAVVVVVCACTPPPTPREGLRDTHTHTPTRTRTRPCRVHRDRRAGRGRIGEKSDTERWA